MIAQLRRQDLWLGLVLVGAALAAWLLRHVEDDAFITYRYSRHLAEGIGPVWNPEGVPVEGFSNFLWMAIMAIPHALGLEIVAFSHTLSILSLMLNISLSYFLVRLLISNPLDRFLAIVLVASSYTLLGYATSGLETAFNGMLVTGFLLWTVKAFRSPPKLEGLISGGVLASVLLLSRHDNAVLLFGCGLYFFATRNAHRIAWSKAAVILVTLLLIMVPFLFWRHAFYGEWLPNTFYAKGQFLEWQEGIYYIVAFLAVTGVFLPLLGTLSMIRSSRNSPFPLHLLGMVVLVWALYLLVVGGDYMEFRMWVPVIPAFYIWIVALLSHHATTRLWLGIGLGFVLLCNVLHGYGHGRWYQLRFVNPIHWPTSEDAPSYLNMVDQAKGIDALFGGKQLTIATGNCGAFAYYNDGLNWVDLYGLNDAWIARNGIYADFGPGHRLVAPFEYFIDQKVNLVTVACFHADQLNDREPYRAEDPLFQGILGDYRQRPGDPPLSVVELPVSEDFALLCLYLHPSLTVEVMTAKGKLPAKKPLLF